MEFLLIYNCFKKSNLQYEFVESLDSVPPKTGSLYIEKLAHLDYFLEKNNQGFKMFFGDVINTNPERKIRKGVFYSVITDLNSVQIIPDDHGFLPIYYFEQDNLVYVTSSISMVNKLLKNKSVNSDFYTQISLIYSNLLGSTYFNNVKRLSYGESLHLGESIKIQTDFRFFDYFTDKMKGFKQSVSQIADKFIEISKYYLDKPCAISLTGGFDGRTVTACAHHNKTDFFNFSYGKKGSGDVDNPAWIAHKLGLNYEFIELGKDYLRNSHKECMKDYIRFSGGFNGFQSPQSIYYVKEIAKKNKIIVTGYLGSEVLANAHSADEECTPQTVIDKIRRISNENNYAFQLYPLLNELNIVNDSESIRRLLDGLDQYFNALPSYLTDNQKFAVFSFENVYRNTFGVWIYNSLHYVKLRVPFMDNDFLDVITKTEVSQFYREFLERRMKHRIKGQLLYPNIMRKTWPAINALDSSKGYAPKDVAKLFGKFRILFRKKLKINKFKERNGLNKLSSISGAVNYMNKNVDKTDEINKDLIEKLITTNALNRSLCFLSLSKFEFEKILNLHNTNHKLD
jgi:hypothetical protein